eukprot:gene14120-15596_t
MSEKPQSLGQSDPRKKKKKNKNRNKKKGKNNEGSQKEMDLQFSVDVAAPSNEHEVDELAQAVSQEESTKPDEETLVVDVADPNDQGGAKVSTTETVMSVEETFDVDELPEDVRQDLLKGMNKSNVTVVINGKEVELPPGVTPESLSEEDFAKLFASANGDEGENGGRIIEVTETIVTEGNEGEDGDGTEVIVTTEEYEVDTVQEHAIQDHHHHHDYEEEKAYQIEAIVGTPQPEATEDADVDSVKKVEVTKMKKVTTARTEEVPVEEGEGLESNVVIDVQTSPWKVDTDVEEIVHNNKRVRMTRITKSRRVIVTKTADGEEIETVVEEEDEDENPEVIGEIGEFDDTHNETIEIQKVTKKRRIIITRNDDGEEVETIVESDHSPTKDTESTIVKTRRVIITQNEFGEDVETIIEDDQLEPCDFQGDIECKDVIEVVETEQVEAEPFQLPDAPSEPVVTATVEHSEPDFEVNPSPIHHHFVVHKMHDDNGPTAHPKDITHVKEEKVELTIKFVGGDNSSDDVIQEDSQAVMVESEVVMCDSQLRWLWFSEEFENPEVNYISSTALTIIFNTIFCIPLLILKVDKKESLRIDLFDLGKTVVEDEDIAFEVHATNKVEELNLEKLDDRVKEAERLRNDRPVNITMTLNVPRETKPRVSQKLTPEQRKMLEDLEMPKTQTPLDDWVLVNFTADEIARFAELVRYMPGWMEKSGEIQQQCCKLM